MRVLSLLLSFVLWYGFGHLWNLASMNISDLSLQRKRKPMYQWRAFSKLLVQRRFSSFKASNKVIQMIYRLYSPSLSNILYVPMNYFKIEISNIKVINKNASAVTLLWILQSTGTRFNLVIFSVKHLKCMINTYKKNENSSSVISM